MSKLTPQATAGRMVHFYALPAGSAVIQARAAVVNKDTEEDGTAELTVFWRSGPAAKENVRYSADPALGAWSWMPYQKKKAESAEGNQSESAEPRPDA